MLILLNISCVLFLLYRCKIENLYTHQRHCSLLIVYNLQSQIKQALHQLEARNKIYKGANRLGRQTGKWAKRRRGERKSRRNDSGVKRLRAKGKVVETTRIQVNVDTKRVPEVTKLGTK